MAYIPRMEDLVEGAMPSMETPIPQQADEYPANQVTDQPEKQGNYIPSMSDLANIHNDQQHPNAISAIPGVFSSALQASMNPHPLDMAKARLGAIPRGLKDIWEGIKQVTASPDEAQKVTARAEGGRMAYDQSYGSKDPIARLIRGGISSAPMMGALMTPGLQEGALMRLLTGGLAGGAAKFMEYRHPDESRAVETAKGVAEGGVLGAAEYTLPKVSSGLKGVASLLKKLEPKELARGVQSAHDALLKKASDGYEFIKDAVSGTPAGKIHIDPELISQAERHLPKTKAVTDMIERAKNGNYEDIHKLQSDLGKKSRKALSADSYAENNQGEEMKELRENLNDAIEQNFDDQGRNDLVTILKDARKDYRQLHDTYYSHSRIGKMVDKDIRLIPKDPMALFSEDSARMRKLFSLHPELEKAVDIYKSQLKGKKALKYGIPAGAAFLGAKGAGIHFGSKE